MKLKRFAYVLATVLSGGDGDIISFRSAIVDAPDEDTAYCTGHKAVWATLPGGTVEGPSNDYVIEVPSA